MNQPIRSPSLEGEQPHSSEAERVIIGGVFVDNGLIAEIIDIVGAPDFYVPANRYIFEVQLALFQQGKEIKAVLVEEELARSAKLQSVGDLNFISSFMDGLPGLASLESYAKVVKAKSMLRQLYKASLKIAAEVMEQEEEEYAILDHANKAIYDVTIQHTPKKFVSIGALVHTSIGKAHTIQQSGTALTGIPTGFADLDSLTLGFQNSDLIIIAGRPSMGKSAIGMQIATHAAKQGFCVAFFSLEMPEDQVAMRVLCTEAKVDSTKYRAGWIALDEWDRINEAEQVIAGAHLYVDDTPAISVLQLKAKAMRLAVSLASEGLELKMIVVDYLQLMSGSEKRFESRQQEVTDISKGLKSLARELNIPMVALSQLSRAPENRTNHRPILADLRESGAIEQDADLVAFMYREDQYKAKNEPKTNVAEVIVAKHRNGGTDTVYLQFDATTTRFADLYNQPGP